MESDTMDILSRRLFPIHNQGLLGFILPMEQYLLIEPRRAFVAVISPCLEVRNAAMNIRKPWTHNSAA
jgi:hypothetical protein